MNRHRKLSQRERDLATAFFALKRVTGSSPTLRELSPALGITISTIRVMLRRMEEKGYVRHCRGRARSLEIITDVDPGPVAHRRERFVEWVRKVGHSELARLLHTTRFVVHSWTNSQAKTPKPPSLAFANRMIELSIERPLVDGPLTFADIYDGTTGLRGQSRSVLPSPAIGIAGKSDNTIGKEVAENRQGI